jgi:uncharacterized protein (TIGR00299 family) protein
VSRVAWFDAFAGIAGDMTVAALVDAGASFERVQAGLAALAVTGWSARVERVTRGPFAAARFVVEGPAVDAAGHPHRPWREIRALLAGAPLVPRARDRALAVFTRLARAEATIHGTPVDEVVLHEVGAVDAIVDVVGACLALEELGVDEVRVSELPLGRGRVYGAHGATPLPAPATLELLRGFAVTDAGAVGETVTPTGAALVAGLATAGPLPTLRPTAIGYGAGSRDPSSHPNVLRVVIGDVLDAPPAVLELRAEVDGLTGEEVPALLQALLDAGALDAYATPVLMKKGRPGLLLTVLAPSAVRGALGDLLLRRARTLGYRWSPVEREALARRHVEVATPFGPVRIKLGERDGVVMHAWPEYEDCAPLAAAAGVGVAVVQAAAFAAWSEQAGDAS